MFVGSLNLEPDKYIIKNLPQRFLLSAVLLLIGIVIDLPWIELNKTGILAVRGTMIGGAVFFALLSRYCRSRVAAETLIFTGVLFMVTGMAVLGWFDSIYLEGYTSAVYQTLAFVTIFLPLRTMVFLSLSIITGLLWFLVFPYVLHLNFNDKLFFSHIIGYSTYVLMCLAGNHLFFRLWSEEERQRENLKARSRQLLELATKDGLTGVYNFRHFQDMLPVLVDSSQKYERPLALCLIDLDDFKLINDKAGHVVGNAVLQNFAQILLSSVRQDDTVFRIGGDEFAIILPGVTAEDTLRIAERFLSNLAAKEQPMEIHRWPVYCSIGIAELSPRYSTSTALIEAADRALYKAKETREHKIILADTNS